MRWAVCSTPGCATLVRRAPGADGRCPEHRRAAEHARRPNGNPYRTPGHQRFREAVLARDPVCVLCRKALATVADHYPTERRDLVEQGLDPDNPTRGRGLCKPCHDKHTAATSPGGWHVRE